MRWRVVCRRCGRTVYVPIDARMHWHRCNPPRRRSRYTLEYEPGDTIEERRTAMYEALRQRRETP